MRHVLALVGAIALVSVSTAANSASTDGKNRKVLIVNVGSQAVNNLYASPITAKTWEEDLLGQRLLGPGESISANIDNGTNECNYDLKVVMKDGKEQVQRNINVCVISKWVVGDSGNVVVEK